MIIIIILSVLTLLAIGLWIYGAVAGDDCDEAGMVGTGVFGFALLVAGVWCLIANNKYMTESTNYEIHEQIKLYQNERRILESYHLINDGNKSTFTSDITLEVISTADYYSKINEYNDKIFDFKVDINNYKLCRKNKWINWFMSPAYESIPIEELDALTYTIGKESE